MSGAIEDIAKKWLSEPAYTKVFKHTADVIEDYLCYFLTAVGAIALSIRFLSSLGTGDLSCIVAGRQVKGETCISIRFSALWCKLFHSRTYFLC